MSIQYLKKIPAVFFYCLFINNIYAQSKTDSVVCSYFTEFFQSQETVGFLQDKLDTIVTIYDPDSILTKCGISVWGDKKLNVVTVGKNIDDIKKYSDFITINDETNYIIVSKIKIEGVVHYHVYKHCTGANASISLRKMKRDIIKLKTRYGFF